MEVYIKMETKVKCYLNINFNLKMFKQNYEFIEIGTSNFDTIIENTDNETFGITIEPIKYYLDKLPNKRNVKKINKAVTDFVSSENKKIIMHYIPEDVIDKHNLGWWLKGCNSVNDYHLLHKNYNIQHLVSKEEVDVISIKDLFLENNVGCLNLLKIDTEGHDVIILQGLHDYLSKLENKDLYPKKIIFESNAMSSSESVDDIIKKFTSIGYELISRGEDTVIEYKLK